MYVAQGLSEEAELRRLCEAAYNARAAVPEFADIMVGWELGAAAYREEAEAELDLPYLDELGGGSARTLLDLFWPRGRNRDSCPLSLYVHGGYWQALDRKYFSHLARGANGRGIAVAVASYDLCPNVDIATIERQVACACLYLWNTLERRVILFGHSAGGHLTAALLTFDFAALDAGAPARLVPAGLAISGLFDLSDLVHTSINDKLGLTLETARRASPMFRAAPRGKRLIACVGAKESEAFHWQSREIARRWRAGGAVTEYVNVPDTNHFTVIAQLCDPESTMVGSLEWLAAAA
jgi:arylformamidase